MKRASPSVLALIFMLCWVACDHAEPTAPIDVEASFAIWDAAHPDDLGNANAGFFWLPPMVDNPEKTGTFYGGLDPKVIICGEEGVHGPCVPENCLLTYTRTTSPGVSVDVNGHHYQLNWDTDDVDQFNGDDLPDRYRISVWLGNQPLGHADVLIDKNAKNFQHGSETIGLIDGRTLPIKFRLEYGLFDAAFQSDREGSFDVFLLHSWSGATANISNNPALDGTPNWSPDGSRIVFASDRASPGQAPDIYGMNPDGTEVQLVAANGWQPEYSPDGSTIAFQRGWPPEPCWGVPDCEDDGDPTNPLGREHDIWIMDADGGNQTQLTDVRTDGNDFYEDFSPTWHPTEPWVTFGRARNSLPWGPNCQRPPGMTWDQWLGEPINPVSFCGFDVVSVDVSQADLPWIRHTYQLGIDHLGPKWSPDGSVLTVKRNADDGYVLALLDAPESLADWYVRRDAGWLGYLQILTPENNFQGTEDGDLAWSSDGSRVLFTSRRSGDPGIYLVGNWAQWLGTGPSYTQSPLVVGTGERNDWPRWRPNPH